MSNSELAPVIETQEIRIVDAEGRVRARFGMLGVQNKTVGLHLMRSDGSVAVEIDLEEDNFGWNEKIDEYGRLEFPQIILRDKAGKQRLTLSIGDSYNEEYSGLSICGSDGEAKVTLVVPPGDYGEISITDHNGRTKGIQ